MDLIDTHQHLILRDRLGYDWTASLPALARSSFEPADYLRLTEGRRVVGTIFMETGVNDADYEAEARLVSNLVGHDGMRGQIASCRPERDEGFDAWLEECLSLNVVGFRRILHVVPDDLSQSGTFRKNLRKIGAAGLPFDLCFLARQHALAEELLSLLPDQVFVLDHCGNPDVAGDGFAPWAASLRRLATFPNLFVKLSGITANCAPGTVSYGLLKPYIDHVVDCFGPDRVVWGSDWPVVDLRSSLPDWITLTGQFLSDLSDDERHKIGVASARIVYGV